MAGTRKVDIEVVGQDSFLDVIANLVGILIILVMVVGVGAKDAIVVAGMQTSELPAEKAQLESEVAAAKLAADQVESDFRRIESQRKQQDIEAVYREEERNRVQLLVTAAERAVSKQREKLDQSQRDAFDRQKEMLDAESELEDLHRSIGQAENATPQTAIIEHLPTPMAKTVFGHELHLRLHRGRVVYVPWDEFVQRLKEEVPSKVSRLRDQTEFTDSIGPLGGFWMKYTLKRESQAVQGKVGVAVQQMVILDKFVLLAESEEMGEPLADALREGSQLNALLAAHRPAATTITVWTYPDSYGEFRHLKRALFDRGYVTAARPLPENHPIGGSPEGTRSAAQ